MADGGYSPREIDKFVLADLAPLYAQWAKIPPVRFMVGAYVGVKTGSKRSQSTPLVRDAASIKAMNPGGILR